MQNRAAMLTAVQKIEMMDVPMPVCQPSDVIVQVDCVGVCGSDIHFYQDGYIGKRMAKFPMVLGHEAAGRIVEVGSRVSHLKTGDLVAIEPQIPCGTCEFCKEGRYNLCPDVIFMATPPYDGVLQKYVRFPAHMCYALPDGCTPQDGALLEPFSVALHAARLGKVKPGDTVAILGSGCIGLMTIQACRMLGASKIIVSDLFDNRLDNALTMGADAVVNAKRDDPVQAILDLTNGEGAHVVFETAGNSRTAYQTSCVVRRGGCIVLTGNIVGDVTFNFRNMTLKEAQLKTVWRYCNTYPAAIDAIVHRRVSFSSLEVAMFDFEDSNLAFYSAMTQKDTIVKALIQLPSE